MYKVINIGTQAEHVLTGTSKVQSQIFCKIKIEDGELSISGVIGPRRNGDCRGCSGQIYNEIKPDVFADGWNQEKLGTFIDIWKEWHLNGMKAYTPEMKAAGWDKLASKAIYKYSFGITSENRKKRESLNRCSNRPASYISYKYVIIQTPCVFHALLVRSECCILFVIVKEQSSYRLTNSLYSSLISGSLPLLGLH